MRISFLLIAFAVSLSCGSPAWAGTIYYSDRFGQELAGALSGTATQDNNPPNIVGPSGIGGQPLWTVNAMAVDRNGNVYASCNYSYYTEWYDYFFYAGSFNAGGQYISRSSQTNTAVWVMGIGGSALACDPAGNLYSSDGNTVTEISTNQIISTYASCPGAIAIAFDPNTNLLFSTTTNVQIVAQGGTSSNLANLSGTATPQALALDSSGNIYVATSVGIEQVTPAGSDSIFFSWTNVSVYPFYGFEHPVSGLFIDETNGYIYFHYAWDMHPSLGIGRVSLSPPGIQDTNYEAFAGFYDGTMTYTPLAPVQGPLPAVPISIYQNPANATNSGDSATFTVLVNGTPPFSYQWFFNATNLLLGATNSTLTLTNVSVANVGLYNVVVSGTGNTFVGSNAILYVVAPPVITLQPTNQLVSVGDNVTFTVQDISTTPVTYQWVFNETNIVGANGPSYSILDADSENLGNYSVIVSNQAGATISDIAILQMYPFLSSPFTGITAIWGRDATLTVAPGGTGPFIYQWFMNSAAIAGATNQTLVIPSIQFTNSGLYSVVVSSPFGSVTNTPEQVVVNPAGVSIGFSPDLTINGVAGYSYVIQSSTNLANTNAWLTVGNVTLTQPVEHWVDTNVDASSPFNPRYFYRVLPGQ